MLTVYNSLTRQKEIFTPRVPGKVGMYVCGITVYDFCHLGHARSMVCFDVILRALRAAGFEVTFVRNITDIDDKIINRAVERGVSVPALTEEFIDALQTDASALSCITPTHEPRATTSIEAIIHLIGRLIDEGIAYVTQEGDVCFEVTQFEAYGKLSNKQIDSLVSGIRIEVDHSKRSPLDFVLWKRAKPNEPSWPSPWGEGRPGWHIECSAMAMEALGETFDIHGGGLDLQFPHHENEIAQSEAATHKPFANYWLHVGLLTVNHEKMSKSTGNFLTIQDALKKHHPEVIRYFLLSSHYRSPLNYSEDTIQVAQKALTRLYQALRDVALTTTESDLHWVTLFNEALFDDFNTPVALAVLFDLSHQLNKTPTALLAQTLKQLAGTLGLLQEAPAHFLQQGVKLEVSMIEQWIEKRKQAKQQSNWALADEIRAQLLAEGIELEDSPTFTTWRYKNT